MTEIYKRRPKPAGIFVASDGGRIAMNMTRRDLGIISMSVAIGATGAGRMAMAVVSDSVHAKVKAVLDGWNDSWNASDMTAMSNLFVDDAHWVNVVGMHWRGKGEIMKALSSYFELMFKERSSALDEIESIEPLPGGAFVTVVRWSMGGFKQPDGVVRPPGKDRMSLVMIPRGDGLAIAHGANIAIVPEAAPFDPIKR
jgi:uncharacterized protein (TIGR02246 family)